MAVSVSLNLQDIRKTQNRVKCLIKVNDVKDVQQYPLRRRPLPPGFCYVCSRLDPNARHKTPNGYLFAKGFFAHCEHMQPPRPPYPTFIEDDQDIDIPVLPPEVLANRSPGQPPVNNPNVNNLSVSVTIKNKNSPSPDQKYSKKYFDTAVLNGVDDYDYDCDEDRYRLPPVFDKDFPENGKHILHVSDKTFAEAGAYDEEEHTYLSDDDFKVPHLPSLSNGRSMTSNQNEYKHDPTSMSPVRPSKMRHPLKKKKSTKREGERTVKSQVDEIYRQDDVDYEDEEGVLKYNHRDEFSSLPNEGLEMAPSRDNSKLNSGAHDGSSGTPEVTFGDRRRSHQENPPSMTIQKIGSAELWCECTDLDHSKLKCEECAATGGHENWCTYARSASRHGKCPKCGKHVRKTKTHSTHDLKSDTKRKLSFTRRLSKMTTKSDDSDTTRKRPLSDTPLTAVKATGLHVRFEDDKDSTHAEKHMDSVRSKTVTDEDYKKYDKAYQDFVYNREGWAEQSDYSDEEDFEDYPKVHPRVDPNIHRDAYSRAIAARSLEKLRKMNEVDEKFAADRISKPHVFSYFKLRPHQKNALPGGPDNIGILPSESANVRPRKAMQHIFGKIKVDDFYPGGKRNKSQVSVSYNKEKNKQTMPINKWTRGGISG